MALAATVMVGAKEVTSTLKGTTAETVVPVIVALTAGESELKEKLDIDFSELLAGVISSTDLQATNVKMTANIERTR